MMVGWQQINDFLGYIILPRLRIDASGAFCPLPIDNTHSIRPEYRNSIRYVETYYVICRKSQIVLTISDIMCGVQTKCYPIN